LLIHKKGTGYLYFVNFVKSSPHKIIFGNDATSFQEASIYNMN